MREINTDKLKINSVPRGSLFNGLHPIDLSSPGQMGTNERGDVVIPRLVLFQVNNDGDAVDISWDAVRKAARDNSTDASLNRLKLAIAILDEASKYDDSTEGIVKRKEELDKLRVLYQVRLTRTDREIGDSIINPSKILTKDNPTKEDCKKVREQLAARPELAPPPKAEGDDKLSPEQKAIKLIEEAKTKKTREERRKLLDQAAECLKERKDYPDNIVYWWLKFGVDPDPSKNAELDMCIARIQRKDPNVPTLFGGPYVKTLVMIDGLRSEPDLEKRKQIVIDFEKANPDLAADPKISEVLASLKAAEKLNDVEVDSQLTAAARKFWQEEKKEEKKPAPRTFLEWLRDELIADALGTAKLGAAWLILRNIPIVNWPIRATEWVVVKGVKGWNALRKPSDEKPEAKPDAKPDAKRDGSAGSSDSLRGDRMSDLDVRKGFKASVFRVAVECDPRADSKGSGDRLRTAMTTFIGAHNLDPRFDNGQMDLKVEFAESTDGPSEGLSKANVKRVTVDGKTTIVVTFPKNATKAEIAQDCYCILYEIERDGKHPDKTAGGNMSRNEKLAVQQQARELVTSEDVARVAERSGTSRETSDVRPRETGPASDVRVSNGGLLVGDDPKEIERQELIKDMDEACDKEIQKRKDTLERLREQPESDDYKKAQRELQVLVDTKKEIVEIGRDYGDPSKAADADARAKRLIDRTVDRPGVRDQISRDCRGKESNSRSKIVAGLLILALL